MKNKVLALFLCFVLVLGTNSIIFAKNDTEDTNNIWDRVYVEEGLENLYTDFPMIVNKEVNEFMELNIILDYVKNISENDYVKVSISDYGSGESIDEKVLQQNEKNIRLKNLAIDSTYKINIEETINDTQNVYTGVIKTKYDTADFPVNMKIGDNEIQNNSGETFQNVSIKQVGIELSQPNEEDEEYDPIGIIEPEQLETFYDELETKHFYELQVKALRNGVENYYRGFISTYENGDDLGIFVPSYSFAIGEPDDVLTSNISTYSTPDYDFSTALEYEYYKNVECAITLSNYYIFCFTFPDWEEYTFETVGNVDTMLTFYSADLNGNITGQPDIYRGGGDGLNARTSIFGTPGNKEYIILESDMWSEAGVDRGITNFRIIREYYNTSVGNDDAENYLDIAESNALAGNYSNYINHNFYIDYSGDVDIFVYKKTKGKGSYDFKNVEIPLKVAFYQTQQSGGVENLVRIGDDIIIQPGATLEQPIELPSNQMVYVTIQQAQITNHYDDNIYRYDFDFYAPNMMDKYDLQASPIYGNSPYFATELGMNFNIDATIHYNDKDFYDFTPEYDGTEFTATLYSTGTGLLYNIDLYDSIDMRNDANYTYYLPTPVASGIETGGTKVLTYNNLIAGNKYYLRVSSSKSTEYDSRYPYSLETKSKTVSSTVLKNNVTLGHAKGNDIDNTGEFIDIILKNIESKIGSSIISSESLRPYIKLYHNNTELTASYINNLDTGNYTITVKYKNNIVTGVIITLKVNELSYLKDGVIYPGKDIWWDTSISWHEYTEEYPDDLYPISSFKLESINVVCTGKLYTVPNFEFVYNEILAFYDYERNTNYILTAKVNNDGTAEYTLRDPKIFGNNLNQSIKFSEYTIIPIASVHSDENGQLFLDSLVSGVYVYKHSITPIKNNLSNIMEISSQRNSAVALDSNGNVYAWGDGSYYDLGTGSKDNVFNPVKVEGLPKIVQIAKGKNHTLALDENGNIWGWGNNSSGEVHGSLKGKVIVPTQIPVISNVVSIAAGTGFSVAVKYDGTVWTWGNNQKNQLGDRETNITNEPSKVVGISNVEKVTCGDSFVAVISGGNLYTWGDNSSGQLGDGTNTSRSTPQLIGNGYTDIAAGNSHMLAILDNNLYTWGYNSVGQLGLNNKTSKNTPQLVYSNVSKIGAGYNHSMMVSDGKLYTWGSGGSGQLGNGKTGNVLKPTLVPDFDNINFAGLDGGYDFSLVLDSNGIVWSSGSNEKGQLGIYSNTVTE